MVTKGALHLRIDTASGVPIYLQIIDQVKFHIATGALKADDELPSLRAVAGEYLINPNTVARAYRELESESVVTARRGAGAFVSDDGSPLARREQSKIINDRIDALLAEASNMNVDTKMLIKLVQRRSRLIEPA